MTSPPPWVAALPMYDLPELAAANDALWAAIRNRLEAEGVTDVPGQLTRGAPLDEVWSDPGLLLSQTCGYPLMTSLRGRVALVATPHYRAPGCEGPLYRSAVVVRADHPARDLADLRGARCAVNGLHSNSGMNLPRAEFAPLAGGAAFFGAVTITGGHAASVQAVAGAEADVAAIDCVTWAHFQRLRPAMVGSLRVLAWTGASPGLPLITAAATDLETRAALARALAEVARDPALEEIRAELLLDGFSRLETADYQSILDLERTAIELGYPTLR
jgi:ABC-type phosphate/phosphonate transport system substrate-binding protein